MPGGATEHLERQRRHEHRQQDVGHDRELITAAGLASSPRQLANWATPNAPVANAVPHPAAAVTRRAVRSRWVTSALDNRTAAFVQPRADTCPSSAYTPYADPPSRSPPPPRPPGTMACSISASRAHQGAAVEVAQPLTQRRDMDRTHVPSMTRGSHNEHQSSLDHGGRIDTVRHGVASFGWTRHQRRSTGSVRLLADLTRRPSRELSPRTPPDPGIVRQALSQVGPGRSPRPGAGAQRRPSRAPTRRSAAVRASPASR